MHFQANLKDSGLYHNDGDDTFSKAKGIFNQGLDFDYAVWIDWNMDGLADLLYNTDATTEYGVLLNSGNGSFSKKSGLGDLCDQYITLQSRHKQRWINRLPEQYRNSKKQRRRNILNHRM